MTGQPVTAASRFQAASLSKPVTAWGVLRLVEAGRIGLDEPVPGHPRRWRLRPSPFDADGITVRRLLSHTAGLSVHGYVGQTSERPLPSIAASLAGETADGFPAGSCSLLAAALAGPRGEPPGRGVLSPAGVRLALTAAPATDGRWRAWLRPRADPER
jgi:CubicO group peptidase (beta-lactamase class C family)